MVTGLGIVSPIGNPSLKRGERPRRHIGHHPITRFDPSRLASQIAGEVKGFDIAPYMSPKEARRMDLFIHYGMAAALQAWRESASRSRRRTPSASASIRLGHRRIALIEAQHHELEKGHGACRRSSFRAASST